MYESLVRPYIVLQKLVWLGYITQGSLVEITNQTSVFQRKPLVGDFPIYCALPHPIPIITQQRMQPIATAENIVC